MLITLRSEVKMDRTRRRWCPWAISPANQ